MSQYTLIIISPTSPAYFFGESDTELRAMVCLGDDYILINNYTGATEDNYSVFLK